MAFEFKFPDVGEGITEGEVVKWHVDEGQEVEEDQVLLEVETDKAVVDIPAPVAGTIIRRVVSEGAVINVGDVMVVIGEAGEGWSDKVETGGVAGEETPRPAKVTSSTSTNRRVAAAPATRKLARDLGVDLATVTGTGPGGRIGPEDVRMAVERMGWAESVPGKRKEPAASPSEREERVPMRGVRKRVSEAMVASVRTIPHVTHVDDAEVTDLIRLREKISKRWGGQERKISFLPFFIRAIVENLKLHPAMNASIDDENDEIIYKKYYNIGMATATPDGLIVPVIKAADRLSILELSDEIDRLAGQTRTRKVPLEDLKGATFSITNYGSIGGLFGTPIIHHPETAILGVGKFFGRVVCRAGEMLERDFVYLSLSFDHRVADGADAAAFVNGIKEYVEEPETHFMELS